MLLQRKENNMNISEAIKSRRTIRKFTQKKIETEILYELVDMARLAAFPANIQPLKFKVVNDKETCDKIFPFTKWAGYLENGTPKEDEKPVSYIVAVGDTTLKNTFEVEAGAAVTNIMLAAMEKGIGCCWIGAFDKNKTKEILNLSDRYEVLYLVALGYPSQKSRAVDIKDNDVKYFLDKEDVLNVPKRTLEEIIL